MPAQAWDQIGGHNIYILVHHARVWVSDFIQVKHTWGAKGKLALDHLPILIADLGQKQRHLTYSYTLSIIVLDA